MSQVKNNFVLCSTSDIKYLALKCNFTIFNDDNLSKSVDIDNGTPQPFGKDNIKFSARRRIETKLETNIMIAIENGLMFNDYGFLIDVCYIVILDNETYYDNYEEMLDTAVLVPDGKELYEKIHKEGPINSFGYGTTIGELLSNKYSVPKNDWMGYLCSYPREKQIITAFKCTLKKWLNDKA